MLFKLSVVKGGNVMGRRSNNGECPFISERDSRWGHESYECDYNGKEVAFDDYKYLCRFDEVAIKDCPMRKRDYYN